MDKEWVERTIFEGFELDGWEQTEAATVDFSGPADLIVALHRAELATARRQNVAAILPCGHHASNVVGERDSDVDPDGKATKGVTNYCRTCELERISREDRAATVTGLRKLGKCQIERDQLRAQVAVMTRALEAVHDFLNDDSLTEEGTALAVLCVGHLVDKALSAAPMVVWRGSGHVMPRSPGGLRIFKLRVQDTARFNLGVYDYDETRIPVQEEEEVDVLVLCCSSEACQGHPEQAQESEQGYKRAKGATPWHEGDELPEDTIARLRGRGENALQSDRKAQLPDVAPIRAWRVRS